MKNRLTHRALVAASLASCAFAVAPLAAAGNYNPHKCKSSSDDQLIGGLVGAVAGGVLGSQVAGNGARTEGSVIGAIAGGVAGAAIADGDDCKRSRANTNYYSGSTRQAHYSNRHRHNHNYNRNRNTRSSTYGHNYNYGHGYNNYQNYYGYRNDYSRQEELRYINHQIDELRDRRRRLEARAHYNPSPKLRRKIHRIGDELKVLKDRRRALKKNRRSDRNRGHYHNGSVCYAHH